MTSKNQIVLAPSILAGDHADLAGSVETIAQSGAPWVHLDIMDGHFVPNLTFGPETVRCLRQRNRDLFFDVHLMLDNPHKYIEPFAQAGADMITVHLEPDYPVEATLKEIKQHGKKCGVVLNPNTPAEAAAPFLKMVDMVLLMTVQPGFGGQSFRHAVLDKISAIAEERADKKLTFRLEVDGGVDQATAPLCLARGVDTLVAGSAFFKAPDKAAFAKQIVNSSTGA